MTEFAINSAVSSTTTLALFKVNYGWMPIMFKDSHVDSQLAGVRDFVDQAKLNLTLVHNAILEHCVDQTIQSNKERREEPSIPVGSKVYLSTENLNLPKGRARKLMPKFIGPYTVLET